MMTAAERIDRLAARGPVYEEHTHGPVRELAPGSAEWKRQAAMAEANCSHDPRA